MSCIKLVVNNYCYKVEFCHIFYNFFLLRGPLVTIGFIVIHNMFY